MTGAWLTPERRRVYPRLIGAILLLGMIALAASDHGSGRDQGHKLGSDFTGVWVAGRAVRAGHPAQPYDNAKHAAAQAEAFGRPDAFLPWPYPPYLLVVAGALAALPYLCALFVWQAVTGVLYLAAVFRAVRGSGLAARDVLVPALAFPAVALNVVHGQNGMLSAGLIALGAFCLPSRPVLGGALLGLLVYKPQFALVVPLAIVAGGYWRAAAAAVVTVLVITGATLLAFGVEPWRAFAENLPFVRHVILEAGGLESWKLQSAFAAVRLVGGSVPLAYALQISISVFVVACLAILWRSEADLRLKVAALIVACLLTTPYAVDYDMVMLGPALAALAAFGASDERGFPPYGRTLLALVWIMPLFARTVAKMLVLPLGLGVTLALFVLIVRWSRLVRPTETAPAAATVSFLPR